MKRQPSSGSGRTPSAVGKPFRLLRMLAWPFRVCGQPLWILVALLLGGGLLWTVWRSTSSVTLSGPKGIQLTPEQIASIRSTSKWECLNLDAEEWVDTLRKGIFSDDRLARIYRGTLRLGVDLGRVSDDWIRTSGDSVWLRLPDIVLLNDRFIDEARTRSFYESGTWKNEAKEAMYRTAHARMLRRGFTPRNREEARRNAREQFDALFRTFGFRAVFIEFVVEKK